MDAEWVEDDIEFVEPSPGDQGFHSISGDANVSIGVLWPAFGFGGQLAQPVEPLGLGQPVEVPGVGQATPTPRRPALRRPLSPEYTRKLFTPQDCG